MRIITLGLVLATAARAQSLAVSVMEAQGLTEPQLKRVHRAALAQLEALAAWPVSDALDWKGPKKSCAPSDFACQREKVKGTGANAAVALWLQGSRDAVSLEAIFWLDGERVSVPKTAEASLDAPDAGLKTLLEVALPGWLRRGWGGLRLAEEPPPGSVLKLDGRVLAARKQDVVPVTAGPHQLDVLYPDGRAVLQRIDVAEASRTRVEAAPLPNAVTAAVTRPSTSALRIASYAAWMVGTATLLSSFIVGFVGRQTANGQSPCTVDSRECVTFAMAQEQQRAAQGYAFTANVLLGTGLVLSLAGAGLFTFDVVR